MNEVFILFFLILAQQPEKIGFAIVFSEKFWDIEGVNWSWKCKM